MVQDKRKTLKWLLLILFVLYNVNITLFMHVHYIDGHPVAHSHPYTGTPGHHHHSHTCAEFHTIQFLSLLALLTWGTFMLKAVFRAVHRVCYSRNNPILDYLFLPSYGLRAPPAC